MITLEHNAAGVDDAYLQGLATCFPGAWNEATFQWYLKRPFRSRHPDTLIARDGERVVAGLGINYRRVRSTDGRIRDIGVLTAAWTLPKYQGRGCFRRLVEAAAEVAPTNGCEALLSFVVAGSASAVRLRRIGAAEVPTRYLLLAPGDPLLRPATLPAVRALQAEGLADLPRADSRLAFHYDSLEEWTTQFVDRPHPTTMFEVDAGMAVLEHVGATDRLQFLYAPAQSETAALVAMASRAHAAGRQFFFFTTDENLAERAVEFGLQQTEGAIMILELPNGRASGLSAVPPWASSGWHIQPGDRM
ncbi:MAG TPA: GNAT family N-acetyltransferase [Gammaproteobacteria bacterium]|nr:GNAT family N-acetyltransferase [Gammaproteobacteria bacterium]